MKDATEALEAELRGVVRKALRRDIDQIEWLAAGIGLRRFARVHCAGDEAPRTLIARIQDEEDPAGRPPGVDPEPLHEPIRSWMEAYKLPVPLRFGGDGTGRVELLEDFGDVSIAAAASQISATQLRGYIERACSLIPRIQSVPIREDVAAFSRRLDAPLFEYKARLFAEHSWPDASPATRACIQDGFRRIGQIAGAAPLRLAHRDFQTQNLHVADGQIAMIDLQGALLAPPEYDLVCLLRDSYVELDATAISEMFERTRSELPDPPDPSVAQLRFDALTLTRKGKDHARFLYIAKTRGDNRYVQYVPTTVRHLHTGARRLAGAEPRLRDLCELVQTLPENP